MQNLIQYKYQIMFFMLAVVIMLSLVLVKRRHDEQVNKMLTKKGARKNTFYFTAYKMIQKIRPLKREYDKEYARISTLYPSDAIAIRNMVTKNMVTSLAIAGGCLAFVLISANGSILYIALGLVITYVLYTHFMESKYQKLHMKLLEQFKTFVIDVKNNYYADNKQLDTAIYDTIASSPYEISLHAQRFYEILTSEDMISENNKYIESAPNKFFVLFSAISTITWKYSDVDIPQQKTTNFIRSMNLLKDEINTEFMRVKKNSFLFSGLIWAAILPILFVRLIQLYGTQGIKELSSYYTGAFGTVMMVAIFIISVVCYKLVMNLQDVIKPEMHEHPTLNKLVSIPIINKFVTAQQNNNYSKSMGTLNKIKQTTERMGVKQFILQKWIYAVAGVILSYLVVVGAQFAQTNYIKSDYSDMFQTSYEISEENKEGLESTARRYVAMEKALNIDDEEALTQQIMEENDITNYTYAELIANTVIDKTSAIRNNYYQWYYLIISLLCGVIGYFIPNIMLNNAVKKTQSGMQDEVNQFETIVMMLMYVDNMSLMTILQWMERFSYCFKEPISKCIIDFPLDEEEALTELENQTYVPFRRFIKNMLNVNKQGLVKAFEDIESEKRNSNDERREENDEIIQKNADKGKMIAMVPLAFEIGGYMILPMLLYSTQMMATLNTAMG